MKKSDSRILPKLYPLENISLATGVKDGRKRTVFLPDKEKDGCFSIVESAKFMYRH